MSDGPTLTEQIKALREILDQMVFETGRMAQELHAATERLARAEALLQRSQDLLRAGDLRHEVPVLKDDIRAFLESK